MPGSNGDQVLVLGGSIAGLLAARVLAERFERVVVIERDPLPQIGWRSPRYPARARRRCG
jgi:glycine/D-amino acid oxidase-like deaminating enzyme